MDAERVRNENFIANVTNGYGQAMRHREKPQALV